MAREGIRGVCSEGEGLPKLSSSKITVNNTTEKVTMLFSLDYVYMREYFNHIVRNFLEFGELEKHFIVSFYRYLNMCSVPYLKHFLRELQNIQINDIEFDLFLVRVKNHIISKINIQ